nr:DUF6127 family protein [Sandarakinorhabdus sp.]
MSGARVISGLHRAGNRAAKAAETRAGAALAAGMAAAFPDARHAGADIIELRQLVQGWRDAKKSVLRMMLGWVVRTVVAMTLIGIAFKLGLLRGPGARDRSLSWFPNHRPGRGRPPDTAGPHLPADRRKRPSPRPCR